METQILELGKEYFVHHIRKGEFVLQVTRQNDEWVTGLITRGSTLAARRYNVAEKGEEVTVRKSLAFFTEVTEDDIKEC